MQLRLATGALLTLLARPVFADAGDTLQPIMLDVLAGRLDGAIAATNDAARQSDSHLLGQLSIELNDMASGNYATRNNRAFADLSPHWQLARQAWVQQHRPAGRVRLPSAVLKLAEDIDSLFAVDANRNVAWLLEREDTGWSIADGFYVSVGSEGVRKRRRGDLRTPLGVYWIVEELDSMRLPSRYGLRVFPLDYPNRLDRLQKRTGDGIWIHGIDPDNNVRPPRDTDGCIALVNDRILKLGNELHPLKTPVVIARTLNWQAQPQTAVLQDLTAALEVWRQALQSGDDTSYFRIFADDYTRFGMSHSLWRSGRQAALAMPGSLAIDVDSLSVFLADADTDVYLTRFRQTIRRENVAPVRVWRRFYWQRDAEGRWRIIAEQTG